MALNALCATVCCDSAVGPPRDTVLYHQGISASAVRMDSGWMDSEKRWRLIKQVQYLLQPGKAVRK